MHLIIDKNQLNIWEKWEFLRKSVVEIIHLVITLFINYYVAIQIHKQKTIDT